MRLAHSNEPIEIKFDKPDGRITKVVCGAKHSGFLTNKGEALMCGLGA
jgi:alpha-tubulin suppressor-like RCC1 family protein